MQNDTRLPAADAARPDGGEALQHPPAQEYQRNFPHGYNPATAAFMLHELIEAIETLNAGSLTREGRSIAPLVDAGKALALSLGQCLENTELEGIET